jgi:hypothetical protein
MKQGLSSLVRIIETLLEWECQLRSRKHEINLRGYLLHTPRDTLLPTTDGTNFTDKWRPLGPYSSLGD